MSVLTLRTGPKIKSIITSLFPKSQPTLINKCRQRFFDVVGVPHGLDKSI
jgi:hypothetical protein